VVFISTRGEESMEQEKTREVVSQKIQMVVIINSDISGG
jgi:hypothetical protein